MVAHFPSQVNWADCIQSHRERVQEGATGAGGGLGGSKVGAGSSWATMPVLGELPQELQRRLAGQRCKWGASGTAMAESVVHSAVMGLLLMASEVGRPRYPVRGKRDSLGVKNGGGRRRAACRGRVKVPGGYTGTC